LEELYAAKIDPLAALVVAVIGIANISLAVHTVADTVAGKRYLRR